MLLNGGAPEADWYRVFECVYVHLYLIFKVLTSGIHDQKMASHLRSSVDCSIMSEPDCNWIIDRCLLRDWYPKWTHLILLYIESSLQQESYSITSFMLSSFLSLLFFTILIVSVSILILPSAMIVSGYTACVWVTLHRLSRPLARRHLFLVYHMFTFVCSLWKANLSLLKLLFEVLGPHWNISPADGLPWNIAQTLPVRSGSIALTLAIGEQL